MKRAVITLLVVLGVAGAGMAASSITFAANDQTVYDDALQNGWQSYGWATLNYSNGAPTHSGSASISVSAGAWQAMYLHHSAFATDNYTNLGFWINGGAAGGQRLQVQAMINGSAQPAVALTPLVANTWQHVTLSLTSLGVAHNSMDGFWIQDTTGTTQPTFYVDDITLVGVATSGSTNVSVNAAKTVRTVDARMFGLNTAVWDSAFNTATTTGLLTAIGNTTLRYPGGSTSDTYHWQTNTTDGNTWQWANGFDSFATVARATNAQAIITANYGSGTPQEAAAWVRYSNATKGYGFKMWEVGNENYGSWENDTNSAAHDPYTYGLRAKDYIAQMKAADGSIKVGVVIINGEDAYANNTGHPATNPRTGQTHNGWTPVLLTTLKNLGVTPDFVVYHKYAQDGGNENDASLLQSSTTWAGDIANVRQMLTDYLGGNAAKVEIICTENNSVSFNPGKQTTSLVNGLFLADSMGQALQTELNGLTWWDMRNNQETGHNNSAALYGWRQYGDYGIVSTANDLYPTYYTRKLLTHFAHGGDTVVQTASDNSLLASYAIKRADGTLALLLINKNPSAAISTNIALSGYTPGTTATVYSYGVAQDTAAQTGSGSPDVAQTTISNAGATFSYSVPAYTASVITFAPSGSRPTSASTSVNLGSAFTQDGMSFDTNRKDGNLDGSGATYSATLMPATTTLNGVTFSFGPTKDGAKNVVAAGGQTIGLPSGTYHSLQFLGATVYGDHSGTFRVSYSDGSYTDKALTLTDWCSANARYGEATALTFAYRNTPGGASSLLNHVFGYTIPTDATKTVTGITLPNDTRIKLLAITLVAGT